MISVVSYHVYQTLSSMYLIPNTFCRIQANLRVNPQASPQVDHLGFHPAALLSHLPIWLTRRLMSGYLRYRTRISWKNMKHVAVILPTSYLTHSFLFFSIKASSWNGIHALHQQPRECHSVHEYSGKSPSDQISRCDNIILLRTGEPLSYIAISSFSLSVFNHARTHTSTLLQ